MPRFGKKHCGFKRLLPAVNHDDAGLSERGLICRDSPGHRAGVRQRGALAYRTVCKLVDEQRLVSLERTPGCLQ